MLIAFGLKEMVFLQVYPFFKFPCMSGAFSSFSLHASQNFYTISLIAFFNCKTTLYPAFEKNEISTLDTWELPACILFNCLFSWYDFVRNLGGLYGVSVPQTLALDFAVFSLLTLLQFLFHTSTLFTGILRIPEIVFLDSAGIFWKEWVGDLWETVFLWMYSLLRYILSKEYHH